MCAGVGLSADSVAGGSGGCSAGGRAVSQSDPSAQSRDCTLNDCAQDRPDRAAGLGAGSLSGVSEHL